MTFRLHAPNAAFYNIKSRKSNRLYFFIIVSIFDVGIFTAEALIYEFKT